MARVARSNHLTLLDNSKTISREFNKWRNALLSTANDRGRFWELPTERIFFSNYGNEKRGVLKRKVSLGLDPGGEKWAVQINEPKTAGSENSTSGIGRDPNGRFFLLRQGLLRPNKQSTTEIVGQEFSDRTGLRPINVTVLGKSAKRAWYIVTALDLNKPAIRRNTADFVDRCSRARTASVDQAIADTQRLEALFGVPEQGGRLKVTRNPWSGTVLREQGEVWLCLRDQIEKRGMTLTKPRHADGYEVDGEVRLQSSALLIEIKTGNSAAEIYTGIGQLQLYPKLLPRLANHTRVLLLPKLPTPALKAAIQMCGVVVYTYKLKVEADNIRSVSFSEDFLKNFDVGDIKSP